MVKRVRDATLDSKEAREHLRPRAKPYYRAVGRELHLGYRRLKGKDGTWIARFYLGDRRYTVEAIGVADDISDADGVRVLDYWQAQEAARARMAVRTKASGDTALFTVKDAVEAYIARKEGAGSRLRRYVLGQPARGRQAAIEPAALADVALHLLDDNNLQDWRAALPDALKGTSRRRIINDLRAALNAFYNANRKHLPTTLPGTIRHCFKAEEEAAPVARVNQILTDAQVGQLIRAAREIDGEDEWTGDLFRLVLVLAATGARYSQVARMRVADCQPKLCRLLVPSSHKGKRTDEPPPPSPVPVGQDVMDALSPVTVGRMGSAWLLERWHHRPVAGQFAKWERTERGPWRKSELMRPWEAIRERAGLPPAIVPYALRHSSIVRGIQKDLPIRLVAALHNTSVKMIERHYTHSIADGLGEIAAKAVVPMVPQDDDAKVLSFPPKR